MRLPGEASPAEYGALTRAFGSFIMAKTREHRCSKCGPMMWVAAVMWFEVSRYVDPKGARH